MDPGFSAAPGKIQAMPAPSQRSICPQLTRQRPLTCGMRSDHHIHHSYTSCPLRRTARHCTPHARKRRVHAPCFSSSKGTPIRHLAGPSYRHLVLPFAPSVGEGREGNAGFYLKQAKPRQGGRHGQKIKGQIRQTGQEKPARPGSTHSPESGL